MISGCLDREKNGWALQLTDSAASRIEKLKATSLGQKKAEFKCAAARRVSAYSACLN